MKHKHQRLLFLVLVMAILAAILTFVLNNFRKNIVFFVTPSELSERLKDGSITGSQPFRLGGLVKHGSVHATKEGTLQFIITDLRAERSVHYQGIVPALFREDQGVVVDGTLEKNGQLRATKLLAKHDENYMPPEVARALKQSGKWQSPTQNASP
jgi:cytochrome c-type biogenesis protein CcmE